MRDTAIYCLQLKNSIKFYQITELLLRSHFKITNYNSILYNVIFILETRYIAILIVIRLTLLWTILGVAVFNSGVQNPFTTKTYHPRQIKINQALTLAPVIYPSLMLLGSYHGYLWPKQQPMTPGDGKMMKSMQASFPIDSQCSVRLLHLVKCLQWTPDAIIKGRERTRLTNQLQYYTLGAGERGRWYNQPPGHSFIPKLEILM